MSPIDYGVAYDPSSKATRGGVEKYMYNKIRILLDSIQRREGYPAESGMRVCFYGYLMIGIPQDKVLLAWHTKDDWEQNPTNAWRTVKIGTMAEPDSLPSIFYALGNIIGGLGSFVKLNIMAGTMTDWPIYENLLYKGALNNKVIDVNWDKIKIELNKNGY